MTKFALAAALAVTALSAAFTTPSQAGVFSDIAGKVTKPVKLAAAHKYVRCMIRHRHDGPKLTAVSGFCHREAGN